MTRRRTCPHCGTPVIHTTDNDHAGLPITIDAHPTPRPQALQAIADGRRAVTAERDRTWTPDQPHHRTRYYALTHWRITNPHTATHPHHVEHDCTHPTPPPPKPAATTTTEGPGY